MLTCSYCQHRMAEGALFCERCGLNLVEAHTERLTIESGMLGPLSGWGAVTLTNDQHVVLKISDVNQPVDIEVGVDFILGRGENAGGVPGPNIDLSSYEGLEMGVSRMHAALRRGEGVLTVVDLESTNGTFLNGHRLAANEPHLVRDGDEIYVGNLPIQIFFRAD